MKKIGIPGWMTGENSFGVSISYLEFIGKFGKPVIITPIDELNPPKVDMVIAPGGSDLLPASYGAIPSFRTQKSNPQLEHFDAAILPKYIENKVPIFGICRGMQRIWAMYGGQITQNNTWHDQSKSQTDQCHEIAFTPQFEYYKKQINKVTSRHHQCADASVVIPDELEIIAYAKEDKSSTYYKSVVEIFRHKSLPIIGVQFHPEDHDSSDKLSGTLITELLK